MYDKVLAIFAFVLFAAFVAILGIWVDSIALKVVLIITVLMCGYDFYLDAFSNKQNSVSDSDARTAPKVTATACCQIGSDLKYSKTRSKRPMAILPDIGAFLAYSHEFPSYAEVQILTIGLSGEPEQDRGRRY